MAALCALAGFPAMASAQDGSQWEGWYGPRRTRPLPEVQLPYDDRASDPADDGYEPPYQPRYDRRYDNRRYDEPYSGRDTGDRDYEYRRYRNPHYDPRRDGGPPQYSRRPSGPQPEAEAENGKSADADGGPRPAIAPATPPVVAFRGGYPPGSIVIDTGARKLYYVRSQMSAFAYPIGVGREGFSWTGSEKVARVTDWPDWYPPAEMRKRKPELPERMLGGVRNPLGAKAIYLGNTLYRIHGTNDPKSIGKAESSGCFRMLNAHVLHLASLVQAGTQVTVVRSLGRAAVASVEPAAPPRPRWTQRQPDPRWIQRPLPPPRWSNRDDGYWPPDTR